MNLDNELWRIKDGVLLEYKGSKDSTSELVIPEGVVKINSYCNLPKEIRHLVLPATLIEFQIRGDINTVSLHSNSFIGTYYNYIYAYHFEIHNHNDEETFKTIKKIVNGVFLGVESITILDKKLEPEFLKKSWKLINTEKGFREFQFINMEFSEFEIVDGELIGYNSNEEEILIPEGVRVINKRAFRIPKIKKIILPSTLEIIEEYAFYNFELQSLYLPDSVRSIGEEALGKKDRLTSLSYNIKVATNLSDRKNFNPFIGLRESFNTQSKEYIISNVEIRATNLAEINPDDIHLNENLFITLENEVTLEELKAFFAKFKKQNYKIPDFTITTVSKNQEKTKYYIKDEKIDYIVVSQNLVGIDLELLNIAPKIYIDNTNGKSISAFIEFLRSCEAKKILPNLNTIVIIGVAITKQEKRALNILLQNFFGSIVKYEQVSVDEEHRLKKFKDNIGLTNLSAFDKEIEEQLAKLNSILINLEEKDRITILAKINNLLKKYNFDLKKAKPKLNFTESNNFGELKKDPKYLKMCLINDLKTIFNTLNANNFYKELQEDLNIYEAMLKDGEITLPEMPESIKDKIAFIIIKAKFYNKLDFITTLENTLTNFKSKVSYCIVALTEGKPRLENLNSSFAEEIDELYTRLKRVICIEDIFNDIKTSELARNIADLKNIIRKFDNYHQNEYLSKLDNLIRKYYNFLTANANEDIVSGILEFRKELNPFLEELKSIAPTYIHMSNILNVLHQENEQSTTSKAILDTISEVGNFISSSPLSEEEKEESFNELKKVLGKWQNKIENRDLEFKDKRDSISSYYNIDYLPFSDISMEIERRIIGDLLGIKFNIIYYLTSLENYKEFTGGIIQK